MKDELIERAVECYVETLEKENTLLKDVLRKISNNFGSNAKGRTDRDILDGVLNILMHYADIFEEE